MTKMMTRGSGWLCIVAAMLCAGCPPEDQGGADSPALTDAGEPEPVPDLGQQPEPAPEPEVMDAGVDEDFGLDPDAASLLDPDADVPLDPDAEVPPDQPVEPDAVCLNEACTRRLSGDILILEGPDGFSTRLVGPWREARGVLHADRVTVEAEAADLELGPAAISYAIDTDRLSGWADISPPGPFAGPALRARVGTSVGGLEFGWAQDAPFRRPQRLYLTFQLDAVGQALGRGMEVILANEAEVLFDGSTGAALFDAATITLPQLGQLNAEVVAINPRGERLDGPVAIGWPAIVHLAFHGSVRLPGPMTGRGLVYLADPGTPTQQVAVHGRLDATHAVSGTRLTFDATHATADDARARFVGRGVPWAESPVAALLQGGPDADFEGAATAGDVELTWSGPLAIANIALADAAVTFAADGVRASGELTAPLRFGPHAANWALSVDGGIDGPDALHGPADAAPLQIGPFRAINPAIDLRIDAAASLVAPLELPGVMGALALTAVHDGDSWNATAAGRWVLAGVPVEAVVMAGDDALRVTGQAQVAGAAFPVTGGFLDGRPTLSGVGRLVVAGTTIDPLSLSLTPQSAEASGRAAVPALGVVELDAQVMPGQPLIFTGTADLNVVGGRVSPGQVRLDAQGVNYSGPARIGGLPVVQVSGAWNRGAYRLVGPLGLQRAGFVLANGQLVLVPGASRASGLLRLPAPINVDVPLEGNAAAGAPLNGAPQNGRIVLAGHTLTNALLSLSDRMAALSGDANIRGRVGRLAGAITPNGDYQLTGAIAGLALAGFNLQNAALTVTPQGMTLRATAVLIAAFSMSGPVQPDGSMRLSGQRAVADRQAVVRSCVGNVCVTLRSCVLRDGLATLVLSDQSIQASYRATCCAAGLPCFGVNAAIDIEGRSCVDLGVGRACVQVL